jgi:S-disulfanyl-L-cysteine oxidoreductase SoxD
MDFRLFGSAAILYASIFARAESPPQRSVWSGVYTDAQADQGAVAYKTHCLSCHGDAMTGAEQVPALRGVTFGATWEGVPLSDLFDRMRKTMPPAKSGVVTRQEHASILAYMLRMNGMPAGNAPLASDADSLGTIMFRSHKP